MFAPLFSENTAVQPGHRSATLCWFSGFRPHSSPDPFGHPPPGGGDFFRPVGAAGGSMPRPYGGIPAESRRGDPCGRPERRGRRSLRVFFRSTPPQPVGAIHESPQNRSVMLYRLSDFRPHSSSDPFGATLPPGQCHKLKDSISKYQKGTAIIVQNTT